MKNISTILAAVFLALVLVLYMCTFQVRYTEVAILKTWGKPAEDAITEPGLRFKWPRPIQSVVKYDKRIRILEDRTEETRTQDGKNVILTTYALWEIADPAKFHTNFPGGEEDGEKRLRTTVGTHKHAITGRHGFVDFISTDPAKRKIHAIEEEMMLPIARDAKAEYGIKVVAFGIKKLALPESVTTSIFQAMRSREQGKADRYVAEGNAAAAKILADARAMEGRIMASTRKKVKEIETEAERIVSEYYKEFDEHPELRIFLDTVRTVVEALKERTTLVLGTEKSPWNIFDENVRRNVPQGGQQDATPGGSGATGTTDGAMAKTKAD